MATPSDWERRTATLEAIRSPTAGESEYEFEVPAGQHLEWTENGIPFLVKDDRDAADSDEAEHEHKRERLSMWVSFPEIEKRYGVGTRVYWHFLVFVILTNALLGIVTGVNYMFYLSTRHCPAGGCATHRTGAIHELWCFDKSSHYLIEPGRQDMEAPSCRHGEPTFDAFDCVANSTRHDDVADNPVALIGGSVKPRLVRANPFTDGGLKFSELFTAQYTQQHRGLWTGTTVVAVLLTHSFGLVFYWFVARKLRNGTFLTKSSKSKDHDNPFAFSGLQTRSIPGNERITATARTFRLFLSYFVFCTFISVSFGIVYVLEDLNRRDLEQQGGPLLGEVFGFRPLDLAVTITVTLINVLFTQLCSRLTKMERHLLWQNHRRHHTMKLFSFKVLNVLAMNLAIGVVSIKSACPYNDTGRKFLLLMITDLVVQNLIELSLPFVRTRLLPRYVKRLRSKDGDEAQRPEFDIAEEYLELFYRQFVIYLGMSLFPLMPLLGMLVNMLEFPLDKYRMTKVCKDPKRIDITMKKFLAILLTATAVLANAAPPTGTAWVLSGNAISLSNPDACPLFGKFNVAYQPVADVCDGLLAQACLCAVDSGVTNVPGVDNCGVFGAPVVLPDESALPMPNGCVPPNQN